MKFGIVMPPKSLSLRSKQFKFCNSSNEELILPLSGLVSLEEYERSSLFMASDVATLNPSPFATVHFIFFAPPRRQALIVFCKSSLKHEERLSLPINAPYRVGFYASFTCVFISSNMVTIGLYLASSIQLSIQLLKHSLMLLVTPSHFA